MVGAVCCRVDTSENCRRLYIMTLGCLASYRRLGIGRFGNDWNPQTWNLTITLPLSSVLQEPSCLITFWTSWKKMEISILYFFMFKWTMTVPSSFTKGLALKYWKLRSSITRGSNLRTLTCCRKNWSSLHLMPLLITREPENQTDQASTKLHQVSSLCLFWTLLIIACFCL